MEFNLGASALAAELGAELPSELVQALSLEQLRALADSLQAAKRRQSQALDRAIEDALRHVPFIFRGAVELILL